MSSSEGAKPLSKHLQRAKEHMDKLKELHEKGLEECHRCERRVLSLVRDEWECSSRVSHDKYKFRAGDVRLGSGSLEYFLGVLRETNSCGCDYRDRMVVLEKELSDALDALGAKQGQAVVFYLLGQIDRDYDWIQSVPVKAQEQASDSVPEWDEEFGMPLREEEQPRTAGK